jgi:hypothetical protein
MTLTSVASSIHCDMSENDPSACKTPGPLFSLGSIPVCSASPPAEVPQVLVGNHLVDFALQLQRVKTSPLPLRSLGRSVNDPTCEREWPSLYRLGSIADHAIVATLQREGNAPPVTTLPPATPYSSASSLSAQALPALPMPTGLALAVLPTNNITMVDAIDQSSQGQDNSIDISRPGTASPPAAGGPMVASPVLPVLATHWQGHDLVAIREGRLRAEAYTAHRLNTSSAPATRGDRLVAARLTHRVLPLRVICYPLRFENVFLPTRSPISVIQTFLGIAKPHFGDVVLISVHLEVDGSSTIDVGFRFADEALIAWHKDGFLHNGYYWKISPITSIAGHCFMTRPPDEPPHSKADRVLGLHQAMELESRIQACNATDPIVDDVSTQMQDVWHQLNTVNSEVWGLTSSGSAPTSSPNPCPPCIEIQPHPRPSDWATVSGPSMMSWMRTWTLPGIKDQQFIHPTVDADDHQAYRANYHIARMNFSHWHGEEVQLSLPPLKVPVDHTGRRDLVQGFAEIWDWYKDSLLRIDEAYARHPSLVQMPSLSDLPMVSTPSQRRDAVRQLSYDILRSRFSPQERLHSLSAGVHTAVTRRVGCL